MLPPLQVSAPRVAGIGIGLFIVLLLAGIAVILALYGSATGNMAPAGATLVLNGLIVGLIMIIPREPESVVLAVNEFYVTTEQRAAFIVMVVTGLLLLLEAIGTIPATITMYWAEQYHARTFRTQLDLETSDVLVLQQEKVEYSMGELK